MNGGVLHAVECLALAEISDAQSGYRFFGLDAVADLLLRGRTILETGDNLEFHEHQLDAQYAAIIPDDTALLDRIQKHYQLNPGEYAPL